MAIRDAILAGFFGGDEQSLRLMQLLLDELGVAEIVAARFERVTNGDDWLIGTDLGLVEAHLRVEYAASPAEPDGEDAREPGFLTSGDARLTAWPDVREIGVTTRAISGGTRPILETRLTIGHPRYEAIDLGTGELAEFAANLIREQRRA